MTLREPLAPGYCRNRWSLAIVLALAALCRPAFLLWTHRRRRRALVAKPVAERRVTNDNSRGPTARGRIANSAAFPAAFALGVLLVLSPWAIRNQLQFGRPIVTTTHGGYTLLLANNPEFYDWLRSGSGAACGRPTSSTPIGTAADRAMNCRPIGRRTPRPGRPFAASRARFSMRASCGSAVSGRRCRIN